MQVPERFCWLTTGKANDAAMVTGKVFRLTVLTSRLIRLEYDSSGLFEDRASQTAFHRMFDVPDFSVERSDGLLTLQTEHLLLQYKEDAPFSADTLQIRLLTPPATTWHYGDEIVTLGGTIQTLDRHCGIQDLHAGLISIGGYTVLDDSDRMVLEETGWPGLRADETLDLYFFGYGHEYLSCIQDYYRLTGVPPLLPAYALGNWWSRFHPYTQEEYLALHERFTAEDIPFSVGVLDIDWHPRKLPDDLMEIMKDEDFNIKKGWTGYSWNRELFPDPKAMLRRLKEKNLKVSLNLHPAAGCLANEDMYEQMAEAVGIDPKTSQRVKLDVLNPEFMVHYFDIMHHPHEKDGIDFWWMDWQQGNSYWWLHDENDKSNPLEKMDPMWMLNHLHILDISRSGNRSMFFSRYTGPGSHRYPVGFSGDTTMTWEDLDFQPYFTATASNVGYSWWSHDIGGHYHGYRCDELMVRWLQLGVFSPINRLHTSQSPFDSKSPWDFSMETEVIMKQYLRLRHAMFPYLYTMNWRNHNDLTPLILPLYYQYPENAAAYTYRNQYFFGSELMVAPITQKATEGCQLGRARVFFPKGLWIDFFRGTVYEGEQELDVYRKLSEMPVFAKAGGIVPMAPPPPGDNRLISREEMELLIFPGASNRFTLYEDAGEGSDYRDGAFCTTDFVLDWSDKKAAFRIEPVAGNTELAVAKRTFRLKFRGFKQNLTVTATVGDIARQVEPVYDKESNTTTVALSASYFEEAVVTVACEAGLTFDNSDLYDRIFDILLRSQIEFHMKNLIWTSVLEREGALRKGDYTSVRLSNTLHLYTGQAGLTDISQAVKEYWKFIR